MLVLPVTIFYHVLTSPPPQQTVLVLSLMFHTLRCQISVPPLINFSIFPTTRTLLGPPFINVKDIDFFTNPSFHFISFHFISLLVLFTTNFHGKIVYCCKYFSFMLYDNLFWFFSSLYNDVKHFLNLQLPVYFDPPVC